MHHVDRYTCDWFLHRLPRFLDEDLDPAEAERLREHLETCARCAREHHFEQSLLLDLRRKLRAVTAPAQLRDRLAMLLAVLEEHR